MSPLHQMARDDSDDQSVCDPGYEGCLGYRATIRELRASNADMLSALEEYASLMERAGRLHPSRDLREVISDPEHLAIRTRATIRRAEGR